MMKGRKDNNEMANNCRKDRLARRGNQDRIRCCCLVRIFSKMFAAILKLTGTFRQDGQHKILRNLDRRERCVVINEDLAMFCRTIS